MTRDPLLSTETDELTRSLLSSAQNDEPSAAAYARVAAALGVGVAPVAVASLASIAPGASVAPSAAAHLAARWWLPAALKSAGFVVASGLIIGGALLYRDQRDAALVALGSGTAARAALDNRAMAPVVDPALGAAAPRPGSAQAGPAPFAAAQPALGSEPSAVANTDALAVGEPASPMSGASTVSGAGAASAAGAPDPASTRLRPATAARLVSGAPAAADPPKPAVVSSLSEQVMALDRVRVALAGHRAADALQEIAHYRTRYPKGVFLIEASVLEIEALAVNGERSLAAGRAQAFLKAHPDSPHASRLRALLPQKD